MQTALGSAKAAMGAGACFRFNGSQAVACGASIICHMGLKSEAEGRRFVRNRSSGNGAEAKQQVTSRCRASGDRTRRFAVKEETLGVSGSDPPPPVRHPPPPKGKEEEEGQRVVRSRWTPPPLEGKGPREGQRMAIGQ